MQLTPTALVLIGLLLSAWTAAAAWIALSARARERQALAARTQVRRLSRMLDSAPALPLLVRADGRIEGPERLAAWLGLEKLPAYLSELRGPDGEGLPEAQLEALHEAVRRTQKTAAPFAMVVVPAGGEDGGRSLALRGQLADAAIAPNAAALVWWFDFSESQAELERLREEADQALTNFAALVGLIEVAPMPMWFRGADLKLRLVNRAYVQAVGAEGAEEVIARQVELVELVDGVSAPEHAGRALEHGTAVERIVQATLGSQRLALRVSDLPLGHVGIAGYAVDIEEQERRTRSLRAFREAQRSILDNLSVGVAQFDQERRLIFANEPMRRIFGLPPAPELEQIGFDRLLDRVRDGGRLPETRDYPEWRRELSEWFTADEPVRVDWSLPIGAHLKVVGQPMPDGGLVLVAEDRSEQLALFATRDMLLRVRTAMVDNLFEALAVFAPDGRVQLWNRRFGELWALPDTLFEAPPRIEVLLEEIGGRLANPDDRVVIGEAVRAATLDRKQRSDQVLMADGRMLLFTAVPLPDGNGLLTAIDISGQSPAGKPPRKGSRSRSGAPLPLPTPRPAPTPGPALAPDPAAAEPDPDPEPELAGAPETIELLPFVTAVVREREQPIEDRDLTLDLRGSRSSGSVTAQRVALHHALGLLLDAAIASAPEGKGRIHVALGGPRKNPRITISDNGAGLSPEQLTLALSSDGAGVAQATALVRSLSRARRLIEGQGGRLALQSMEGQGTTAAITLP